MDHHANSLRGFPFEAIFPAAGTYPGRNAIDQNMIAIDPEAFVHQFFAAASGATDRLHGAGTQR